MQIYDHHSDYLDPNIWLWQLKATLHTGKQEFKETFVNKS